MNQESWVYILANQARTVFYVGVTNDLHRRYLEHSQGVNDSFTRLYHCHCLLFYERHATMLDAIAREKQLKGWTRAKKLALIRSVNPWLYDYAQQWGWAP